MVLVGGASVGVSCGVSCGASVGVVFVVGHVLTMVGVPSVVGSRWALFVMCWCYV